MTPVFDPIADPLFEVAEITRAFIFPGYIKVNRDEYLIALEAGDHVTAHRHVLTHNFQNRISEWFTRRTRET